MPYSYKKVGDKYAVYKKSNGKLVGKTKGNKEALRKYLSALYINANESVNEIFNNISTSDMEYQAPDSSNVSLNSKEKTNEYNLEYRGNTITLYIFITYDNNNNEIYNISFSINDRNDFVNINQKENVTIIQIINYICTFLFKLIERKKPGYLVIEHMNKKLLKIISFICNKHLPNCKTSFAKSKSVLTIRLYNNINENIINEVFDNFDNLSIKDKNYHLTNYEQNITQFNYKGNVLDLMYKINNNDIYFSFRINGYAHEANLKNDITPIKILVYVFSIIKKIIIKFKPKTISFDAENNKFKLYKAILGKSNITDIKVLSVDEDNETKEYQVTIPESFYGINYEFNDLEQYLLLLKNDEIKHLDEIPKDFWNNRDFVLTFLYYYNFHKMGTIEFIFRDYCVNFNNDKEVILCAVSKDSTSQDFISEDLKNDRDVVLASVSCFGFMLYKNENYNNDKEVALLALSSYNKAFEWLSEELKQDPEIIDFVSNKEKRKIYHNKHKIIYEYNPKTKQVDKISNNINKNMNKLSIEEKTFINEQVTKSINNELMIHESEYKGKKVTLNRPRRNPQGSKKKFHVYVKNEKGNVIKVQFGDPNMKIKRNIPSRKKAYRARHHCDNPGPRTKANYWSCEYGWGNSPVSKVIGEGEEKLFEQYVRNEVKKILNTI